MAAKVVGIGNCSGRDTDKFASFSLTAEQGAKVMAPLISECYANFECRLHDASLINKYSLFVWEVVKAHVARSPRYPRTLHYRGDGEFMISGRQYRPLPPPVQAGNAVSARGRATNCHRGFETFAPEHGIMIPRHTSAAPMDDEWRDA